MASLKVRDLGNFIREQRSTAQISLRQLAQQAGVSNPYLSQIERGLRKPSAEILQQIAKALRISAEVLYVQAGILEEREGDGDVVAAVLLSEGLTERQKQVLLEIYEAFRRENLALGLSEPQGSSGPEAAVGPEPDGVAPAVIPDTRPETARTVRAPAAGTPAPRKVRAARKTPVGSDGS